MSLQADALELSYFIRNVRENLLGVIRQLETAHLDNFKYMIDALYSALLT